MPGATSGITSDLSRRITTLRLLSTIVLHDVVRRD
jgi:hypothetical protein